MQISPPKLQWFFSCVNATSVSHFIIALFWYFNLITANNEQKKKKHTHTQTAEHETHSLAFYSFSNENMCCTNISVIEWAKQSRNAQLKHTKRINTLWLTFFRLVIGVDDIASAAHFRYCFASLISWRVFIKYIFCE